MDYEKERTIKGAGLSEKGQVLSVTFQVNNVCILMLNRSSLRNFLF
jgi:predicted 3-demethylubiquinone-9 3-methyltransferase (glyoxalase superfamily)